MSKPIIVINGPNLNLLGTREPHIYGTTSLKDVEKMCLERAAKRGYKLEFHQSNREYEIIDWIHEARETAGGIVINPAAFTHTSVAIHDASGIENANTAAFQFSLYATPGFARKLMLLTYEPKIDSPTAQAGRLRPAAMNWSLVFVFRKKPMPIARTTTLYKTMIARSTVRPCASR